MKKTVEKIKSFLSRIFNAGTSCRRWSVVVISVTLAIMFGAALLTFIVDPHYRYREPVFYDTVYYEVYATAPHFLRNENYDLLFLGTSMVRNIFLEEIGETFDAEPIKLSAAGGTMSDLKKFFDLAKEAKKEKLSQVVLSLDVYSLNKSKEEAHYQEFAYMYSPSHLEDYRYFFSRQTFSNMFYLIKRKSSPKRHRKHQTDRNRMFSNDYYGKPYGRELIISEAASNEKSKHTPTPYHKENYERSMKEELLPMLDENPNIKFTIIMPPYHVYCWCLSERFEQADGLLKQRTAVIKELLKRKNVVIHDLQSDRELVCNHNFYYDTQHFSSTAGKEIMKKVKSGKYIVSSAADAEAGETALRQLIKEYMPEYTAGIEELKNRR